MFFEEAFLMFFYLKLAKMMESKNNFSSSLNNYWIHHGCGCHEIKGCQIPKVHLCLHSHFKYSSDALRKLYNNNHSFP